MTNNIPFQLTYFPRYNDSLTWAHATTTWGEFCSTLIGGGCPTVVNKQMQALWAPIRLETNTERSAKNVREISAISIDLDHASTAQVEDSITRLQNDGLDYLIHTSYSHAPPYDNRFRIVVPFSRPVLPSE